MKFNGSPKQAKWAGEILSSANLTSEQLDALLCYAGPTMHAQGVMDATIVIDNRHGLAAYANSLGKFLQASPDEKQAVAEEAASLVRQIANQK